MIQKILTLTAVVALLTTSCNKRTEVTKLENDKDKASYAIGTNLGQNVKQFEQTMDVKDSINRDELSKGFNDFLSSLNGKSDSYLQGVSIALQMESFNRSIDSTGVINKDALMQGIIDVLNKKSPLMVTEKDAQTIVQNYLNPIQQKAQEKSQKKMEERKKEIGKKNLAKANEFLAKNKSVAGFKTTASGLQYQVIKEGDKTKMPTDNDVVKVIYKGTLANGKVFDDSEGQVREFPLANVVPGFKEGLKLMSKGGKYKLVIPPGIGYGENGNGAIEPNEALVFEVELVDFAPAPKQPQGAAQPQLTPEQMQALQQQMQQQGGR